MARPPVRFPPDRRGIPWGTETGAARSGSRRAKVFHAPALVRPPGREQVPPLLSGVFFLTAAVRSVSRWTFDPAPLTGPARPRARPTRARPRVPSRVLTAVTTPPDSRHGGRSDRDSGCTPGRGCRGSRAGPQRQTRQSDDPALSLRSVVSPLSSSSFIWSSRRNLGLSLASLASLAISTLPRSERVQPGKRRSRRRLPVACLACLSLACRLPVACLSSLARRLNQEPNGARFALPAEVVHGPAEAT